MLRTVLVGLLLAGLAAGVAAEEKIYKWTDARGQVYYTDLPPRQPDATVLAVYERSLITEENGEPADGGDAEPPAEPLAPSSNEPPVPAATVAAVQADLTEARARQCKEAQERYQRYIDSRRLFRQAGDGQREYLTEAELAEARVRARQAVDEYCSPAR